MAKEMLMVPTSEYQNLVGYFKGRINESALLNKAGRTAADRQLILQDPTISDSLALALTKPKARQVRKLTRRIRTGSTATSTTPPALADDDEDAMLNSPVENTLKKILKLAEKNVLTPRPALRRPLVVKRVKQ